MSECELNVVNTNCKICCKLIYLHEEPLHSGCVSAREEILFEMVQSLRCEIEAMKNSFKSVETLFANLNTALNLENMDCEPVFRTSVSPRTLRKTTIEKTTIENTKKTTKKRKRGTLTKTTIPISPLVLSNGTTASQPVSVSRNCDKTLTTHPLTPTYSNVLAPSPSTLCSSPSTASTSSSISTSESIEDDCGITVVPPPKPIFLSGLGIDVTPDQVQKYIKNKLPAAVLTVRKMLFRVPRQFSSFELDVKGNLDIFNIIVQPEFWPALTVEKERKHFLRTPRTYSNLQ
ncbi:hypothetical protein ACFFRR_007856 [Megaselia abdita]